jgi:quercetin dioxygenase-like cupin family protein
VDLRAGEMIAMHVNSALDVVVTCLTGGGTMTVDGDAVPIASGSIVLIPKGAQREIVAGEAGMRYTTCHQRRGGLMPTIGRRETPQTTGVDRVSSPSDAE